MYKLAIQSDVTLTCEHNYLSGLDASIIQLDMNYMPEG